MPLGIFLGILFVVVLACSAFLIPRAWPKAPTERTAIEAFWAPFFSGDPPLVIYSNTRFLGDSKTGLRYIPAGSSPDMEQVVDHYTGIGELASVYELTRLFDTHQASFVLKRSLAGYMGRGQAEKPYICRFSGGESLVKRASLDGRFHHDDDYRIFGVRQPAPTSG